MANSLPMTLRVYQKLSAAVVPLAPALIKRRLKQGKEDPARDRRAPRHEPGRPAARTAGLDSRRQRRRSAGGGRPDRKAARAEYPHPADVGHGDVGGDRRQAVSRRYHPSICALQFAALCRALSRSLAAFAGAVHRVRSVAQSDPVERGAAPADGADQRPDVASLVPALAQGHRHDLGAARPVRRLPRPIAGRCRALCRARQPQRHHHGQSEAGCSGAARRCRQAGAADVGDARPPDRRGGLDPSRRRGHSAGSASDAGRVLSVAAERDRAAASRSRRSHRPHHRGLRPARGACARARNCRPRPPTSMSPTPWANWDCSIGWRRSCSWADRWSSMAGRIRSRRSSSAPRSCTALTSSISPTSTRRSTAPAAPSAPTRRRRWSSSSASCWPIRRRAKPSVAAAERVVEQLGGALDRTLAALEPYLLQLRLEMGAANA